MSLLNKAKELTRLSLSGQLGEDVKVYNNIEKIILDKARTGVSSITIEGRITPGVKHRLEAEGLKVTLISHRNEDYTEISWK